MSYIFLIFPGLIVIAIMATYFTHKFSNWLSRFALVAHDALRPTVFCENCPDSVHGCTHFKGVPSTWEHWYGSTHCRHPYDPEIATAWHS